MACTTCSSDGACGCVSNYKEINFGSRVAWTLGGAANSGQADIVLNPAGQAIGPSLSQLQGNLTLTDSSTGLVGQLGYQLSTDGYGWDGYQPIAAVWQTGPGALVPAWLSNVANYKRFIRFVLRVKQDTGVTVTAIGNAHVIIGFVVR